MPSQIICNEKTYNNYYNNIHDRLNVPISVTNLPLIETASHLSSHNHIALTPHRFVFCSSFFATKFLKSPWIKPLKSNQEVVCPYLEVSTYVHISPNVWHVECHKEPVSLRRFVKDPDSNCCIEGTLIRQERKAILLIGKSRPIWPIRMQAACNRTC